MAEAPAAVKAAGDDALTKAKEEAAAAAAEKQRCEEKYRQLEEKCSEFESSFFDIQMENIRLKSELEKSRKNDE